jgi:hypothetical protein
LITRGASIWTSASVSVHTEIRAVTPPYNAQTKGGERIIVVRRDKVRSCALWR